MRYCVITFSGGMLLLLVAEFSALPAMRFPAAVLLLAAGIGAGISAASRNQAAASLSRLGALFPGKGAWLLACLLAAPVVMALVASLMRAIDRLFARGGPAGEASLAMAGAVVGLLMLVLAIVALALGIHAIGGTARGRTEEGPR